MIRKKSKFWTFCFSLLPGAGEMYLGFMKMGVSLMALFFGLIALAAFLNIGPLVFLAVIAWFYSFFHVHNLSGLNETELNRVEDIYLFHISDYIGKDLLIYNRYHKVIAIALILLGVMLLWNTFWGLMAGILPSPIRHALYEIGYSIPRLVVGIAIIAAGFMMINGKKRLLDKEEQDGNHREYYEPFDGTTDRAAADGAERAYTDGSAPVGSMPGGTGFVFGGTKPADGEGSPDGSGRKEQGENA